MRNYLKLKLFHGYYINISIDLRLEPTVAANVVGRVSKYIRKNQIFHVNVHFLIHPSPASPAANRGWNDIAMTSLIQAGIIDLMK